MKVRNINGTSDNTCKCSGGWIKHWVNFGGKTLPLYCSEISCTETDLVGAHVQKDSSTDKNWYIVPLCKKHNAKTDSLTIVDGTVLVSANVSETCGKK
ncbi:hypothetical protein [Desulforegula conservatrix]|uniref:hypothetical protein n=1 Tax=Desulforegula conservatrix TaxID=153026 RepID=UPI000481B1D6|nr:hypothetical protein [Desulforegula conservatrix]